VARFPSAYAPAVYEKEAYGPQAPRPAVSFDTGRVSGLLVGFRAVRRVDGPRGRFSCRLVLPNLGFGLAQRTDDGLSYHQILLGYGVQHLAGARHVIPQDIQSMFLPLAVQETVETFA
jgi:hypothetical protein